MLPKRKLIKKPRNENKAVTIEQTQLHQNPLSLMQRLKSAIPQVKQEAISVIANLRCMLPELGSQQFLREMINILYQSNTALCNETLCAITNLCEIEPKVVNVMFSLGLDKALINLQATSQSLLKPILIFFITVNEHIKQNYRYLVEGIRQSLTVNHIKQSPELCLQFIYRTKKSNKSNTLSQQMLGQILNVYKSTQSGSVKSYCVGILGYQLMPQKNIQQLILCHLTESLVLINLQQEYEMNFPKQQQKKHSNNNKKNEHQQEEMNQMEEDNMAMNQNIDKIQHNTHKDQTVEQQKLKYFLSAVSGTEVLLEFVLDVMEHQETNKSETDWDEEEDDQDQNEDQQMQGQQQENNAQQASVTYLKQLITQFLHQNMPIFPKFLSTSAPGTQNLVYLFYHLLLQTAKTLPQTVQTKQEINKLIQVSLASLFMTVDLKRQTLSYEEYEVLVQCLQIGLGVIMKHKALGVSDQFLLQFSKKYMLQPSIFESSKLLAMVKASWLIMLEIFSLRYNPQKNSNMSVEHNYLVGQMLKYLIVSLPYSQLQQFRCQVVDTVFDVYSNEKFDQVFVKLGYFQLLQHIVKQGATLKDSHKGSKGKKNKQQKFILDVVKDTKRFLQYKNKMIKHK